MQSSNRMNIRNLKHGFDCVWLPFDNLDYLLNMYYHANIWSTRVTNILPHLEWGWNPSLCRQQSLVDNIGLLQDGMHAWMFLERSELRGFQLLPIGRWMRYLRQATQWILHREWNQQLCELSSKKLAFRLCIHTCFENIFFNHTHTPINWFRLFRFVNYSIMALIAIIWIVSRKMLTVRKYSFANWCLNGWNSLFFDALLLTPCSSVKFVW